MIDNLDKKIIELLKKDSRCPFVEIANQLGVSEGTVRSRVHKMVEEGIIRGFTIKTSSKNVKALVEISIAVNTDTQEIAREPSRSSTWSPRSTSTRSSRGSAGTTTSSAPGQG